MNEIIGTNTEMNFAGFKKVSDLIYFDGPLLSHYIDHNGDNYLFMWIDSNSSFNRWLYFRIDNNTLSLYLAKELSLREVIIRQANPICFMVDIDNQVNYHNNKVIIWDNFPMDLLPDADSYYEFSQKNNIDLASFSKQNESGVLEIRLFNELHAHSPLTLGKLSQVLPYFEDVRKSLSTGFVKNKKREIRDSGGSVHEDITRIIRLNTEYQVVYAMTGSFRLILKPLGTQIDMPGSKSISDVFAEELKELMFSGLRMDSIEQYSKRYDKNLIKKYSDLVEHLNSSNISMDIKWFNLSSAFSLKEVLSKSERTTILSNLSGFNFDGTEEITLRGRFYSLNVNTKRYSFESTEQDNFKSSGLFDTDRARMSYRIKFDKIYEIIVKRRTQEKVGLKDKISDTCISFHEIEDLEIPT